MFDPFYFWLYFNWNDNKPCHLYQFQSNHTQKSNGSNGFVKRGFWTGVQVYVCLVYCEQRNGEQPAMESFQVWGRVKWPVLYTVYCVWRAGNQPNFLFTIACSHASQQTHLEQGGVADCTKLRTQTSQLFPIGFRNRLVPVCWEPLEFFQKNSPKHS